MITAFLIGLFKIILVNIVLSGDNAVVIAMACRRLKPDLQKKAVFWGSFGAIGLRVILTFIAAWMLRIPLVQLGGSLILIWIAVKLLKGEDDYHDIHGSSKLLEAFKTILIADLVMSLDNVVAVAGAARGNMVLIMIGLAVSIPLIIWGSQLIMKLMERFPIIITAGGGLLGYTAGEMIAGDKIFRNLVIDAFPVFEDILPISLALLVIVIGQFWKAKGNEETNASDCR
ncbi:MAG: TerC family protein [Thermoactinomyces sp.]